MSIKNYTKNYTKYYTHYCNEKGELHRLDGPAIEYNNGSKCWYQNGKKHRIDGPAIEYFNGDKFWFYQGERIKCDSQSEFARIIRLKFLW